MDLGYVWSVYNSFPATQRKPIQNSELAACYFEWRLIPSDVADVVLEQRVNGGHFLSHTDLKMRLEMLLPPILLTSLVAWTALMYAQFLLSSILLLLLVVKFLCLLLFPQYILELFLVWKNNSNLHLRKIHWVLLLKNVFCQRTATLAAASTQGSKTE